MAGAEDQNVIALTMAIMNCGNANPRQKPPMSATTDQIHRGSLRFGLGTGVGAGCAAGAGATVGMTVVCAAGVAGDCGFAGGAGFGAFGVEAVDGVVLDIVSPSPACGRVTCSGISRQLPLYAEGADKRQTNFARRLSAPSRGRIGYSYKLCCI